MGDNWHRLLVAVMLLAVATRVLDVVRSGTIAPVDAVLFGVLAGVLLDQIVPTLQLRERKSVGTFVAFVVGCYGVYSVVVSTDTPGLVVGVVVAVIGFAVPLRQIRERVVDDAA